MEDEELRALLAAHAAQIQALTVALGARVAPIPTVTFDALWLDYWETIREATWGKSVRI